MIAPANWKPFPDDDAKLAYLKELKLYPKSAKETMMLCY